MKKIVFPENIRKLADKFREQRLAKFRAEKKRKLEANKKKAKRLKSGLKYAKQIYNWAEAFRVSEIGCELIKKASIIFLFDKRVEGTDWVGLLISAQGLKLKYDGRSFSQCIILVESAEDLAQKVDTKILKCACEQLDEGKIWECIEHRFNNL